jgi:hypothetical protein
MIRQFEIMFIPDSIGQETLLADNPHLDQAAMHTGGQKFLAQTG